MTNPEITQKERYMRAYYHTFTPTGVDGVDAILEAIAVAGKVFHSTADWGGYDEGDKNHWDNIQTAANDLAAILRQCRIIEPGGLDAWTIRVMRGLLICWGAITDDTAKSLDRRADAIEKGE